MHIPTPTWLDLYIRQILKSSLVKYKVAGGNVDLPNCIDDGIICINRDNDMHFKFKHLPRAQTRNLVRSTLLRLKPSPPGPDQPLEVIFTNLKLGFIVIYSKCEF